MRPDFVFSDSSVSPSFFFTTPAKKPRTECGCQPVTFEMAARVVPSLAWSRPRTWSCYFPERDASPSIREGALTQKLLPKRVVVTDETSAIMITIDGDYTMRHKGLRVRVIGAGTGGLCLAQGLKQDDVEVEVFERDHTPTDRLQGYRLSIDATGRRALKACLPQGLFAKLIANSAKPSEGVTFLDHRLNRLLAIDRRHSDAESELPVSRIALRGILSEGLNDVIHYGKRCVAFDDHPQGDVNARFEDGSTTTGDVLIGADGAGSHLRAQLLPQARRVETGVV